MDWATALRKRDRTIVIEVNGRWLELEHVGRREVRVEFGSVASEARDAVREACTDG